MTKRQLKELQEVRRTALPKVAERIVVIRNDRMVSAYDCGCGTIYSNGHVPDCSYYGGKA